MEISPQKDRSLGVEVLIVVLRNEQDPYLAEKKKEKENGQKRLTTPTTKNIEFFDTGWSSHTE